METSGQFQLELAVDSYFQQLQLKGNYTPDDITELKSHLLDEVDALQQKQLDKEEAFMVAKKRLGKEEVLNREYTKVNGLRFYNRDLFITALSICTFLFLFYFYSLVTDAIRQASYFKSSNPFAYGVTNYVFQFLKYRIQSTFCKLQCAVTSFFNSFNNFISIRFPFGQNRKN